MDGTILSIITNGEYIMTHEDYKKFLRDLELDIFDRFPIIGFANVKSVVSKADIKKHSYSDYEV